MLKLLLAFMATLLIIWLFVLLPFSEWQTCVVEGGNYVRGLFWFDCIKVE